MAKTPVEYMLDGIEWVPLDQSVECENDGLPYATDTGVLDIGGLKLKVYQLNTGQRLIAEESMHEFLGMLSDPAE